MSDRVEEGGCRCGAVRFRATGRPLVTMACHCEGCRRMTGGPYSLTAMFAADSFAVVAGEIVAGGADHAFGHRFCGACLSWIFTRPPVMEGLVNVRASLFDQPTWTEPFIETCTAERLPWATTPAVHSFATWPPPERHADFMAEYAAR